MYSIFLIFFKRYNRLELFVGSIGSYFFSFFICFNIKYKGRLIVGMLLICDIECL